MTNLKQEELAKALIQLFNVRYLIDDGYHNNELANLIKVSNTLFNELSDDNKRNLQIWLYKKMNEEDSDFTLSLFSFFAKKTRYIMREV